MYATSNYINCMPYYIVSIASSELISSSLVSHSYTRVTDRQRVEGKIHTAFICARHFENCA